MMDRRTSWKSLKVGKQWLNELDQEIVVGILLRLVEDSSKLIGFEYELG